MPREPPAIVPALLMPPAKVPPVTETAAPVVGEIKLAASIDMPPPMVPVLLTVPVIVLCLIWIPVGDSRPVLALTTPALVELPAKLVLLTQMPLRLTEL